MPGSGCRHPGGRPAACPHRLPVTRCHCQIPNESDTNGTERLGVVPGRQGATTHWLTAGRCKPINPSYTIIFQFTTDIPIFQLQQLSPSSAIKDHPLPPHPPPPPPSPYEQTTQGRHHVIRLGLPLPPTPEASNFGSGGGGFLCATIPATSSILLVAGVIAIHQLLDGAIVGTNGINGMK